MNTSSQNSPDQSQMELVMNELQQLDISMERSSTKNAALIESIKAIQETIQDKEPSVRPGDVLMRAAMKGVLRRYRDKIPKEVRDTLQ